VQETAQPLREGAVIACNESIKTVIYRQQFTADHW